MKIAFLHISDMHFKDKNGVNSFQADKIVDSLNSIEEFNYVVIIISGDIAFSGQANQYTIARKFIGRIISKIKKDFKICNNYKVLCVPGNHDMNYEIGLFTSKELQNVLKNSSYDKYTNDELKKQKEFFCLSEYNNCFTNDKKIFHQKIFNVGDFKIEANLINSGIFSIKEEDKGLHYIPQYCINELNTPTGADFVITIMHHSVEWYNSLQKLFLETAIYGKSSIVFYGHEHYISNKEISNEQKSISIIQAGGILCNNDDWLNSTFYSSILDTDDLKYIQYKYSWDNSQKLYIQKNRMIYNLPVKRSVEQPLLITDNYMSQLHEDGKHNVSNNFLDYFIFPRIQEDDFTAKNSKEYITKDDFISAILQKKKVLIRGGYNSGKSTLLKALFLDLEQTHTVIFYDASIPYGKKAERIIKNCFEDIYGENPADYQRFLQIPKEKKILIIDNVDQIEGSSLENLMKELNKSFEYFIFTSKQIFDLDMMDRMKIYLNVNDSLSCYRILPFYTDKRKQLIEKVVSIKAEDKDNIHKTTQILSEAIKAQRRFINLDPDFIIKYVEYYCNNIGDASNNDNGVFSKVFEANLINALKDHQTNNLSVDKLFVLLSKIAYYIHFNKAYPITEEQIQSIILNYNEDYGAKVKCTDVISAITNAKILVTDDDGNYRFANRNYLAYYIAREVNNKYNATGNNSDLEVILRNACFGINSDVLLFISYITDNIRIQKLILHMANELTHDWSEFDFRENIPEYLKSDYKMEVSAPTEKDRQEAENNEIDRERDAIDEIKTIDIYDYTDDDADKFINQIIRASSLLMLVAKCLPNFEHNMLKKDKEDFIDTIYRLPNKIFAKWSYEANECVDEYITYFKEQSQDYYTRKKEVKDEDIKLALQWASISLLLDLYQFAVYYATKDNTVAYLSEYSYREKDTYKLQHLMMLSKMKSYTQFKNDAISMNQEELGNAFIISLKRIVHHALIYSDDMNTQIYDKLISEFFPKKEVAQKIKLQKLSYKNKKEE